VLHPAVEAMDGILNWYREERLQGRFGSGINLSKSVERTLRVAVLRRAQ
jgi:hypothetical protein